MTDSYQFYFDFNNRFALKYFKELPSFYQDTDFTLNCFKYPNQIICECLT